jgi:hypothetical protein
MAEMPVLIKDIPVQNTKESPANAGFHIRIKEKIIPKTAMTARVPQFALAST